MKKVLIVILNYKTYEMTLNLINELNTLDRSLFDIYVVDNNSTNESANILEEYSEKLDFYLYKNEVNSGYACGNNIGLRYSIKNHYKYSLIMNNDLKIIDKLFLEKMVNEIEKNPNIGCVGPKIFSLDNIIVPPYCDRPSFFSMTIGMGIEKRKRAKYNTKSRFVYRVFGCCMLLNNQLISKVDLLDERTFLYCEEDILAEKFIKNNIKTYYCSEASIVHMESSTVKKETRNRMLSRFKPFIDSFDLYLREYREFNELKILLCKLFRLLVLYIRG
ncbi:glycosyltransferase family 2 protein [Erysipelotrichaceae bacterium HCN-30851]